MLQNESLPNLSVVESSRAALGFRADQRIIDIVKLAWEELMNRGVNGDGHWVGFVKAGELLGL